MKIWQWIGILIFTAIAILITYCLGFHDGSKSNKAKADLILYKKQYKLMGELYKDKEVALWQKIHDLQTTPDYVPAQRIEKILKCYYCKKVVDGFHQALTDFAPRWVRNTCSVKCYVALMSETYPGWEAKINGP